jgi:hypothetical protein
VKTFGTYYNFCFVGTGLFLPFITFTHFVLYLPSSYEPSVAYSSYRDIRYLQHLVHIHIESLNPLGFIIFELSHSAFHPSPLRSHYIKTASNTHKCLKCIPDFHVTCRDCRIKGLFSLARAV